MKERLSNSPQKAGTALKRGLSHVALRAGVNERFDALKGRVEERFGSGLKETFTEIAEQLPELPDLAATPAPAAEAMAKASANRAEQALGHAHELASSAKEVAADKAVPNAKETIGKAKSKTGKRAKKARKAAKKAVKETSAQAVDQLAGKEKGQRLRTAAAVAAGATAVAAAGYAYRRYGQSRRSVAQPRSQEPRPQQSEAERARNADEDALMRVEREQRDRRAAREQAERDEAERDRQEAQRAQRAEHAARVREWRTRDLMELSDEQLKEEYDFSPGELAFIMALSKARGAMSETPFDKDRDPTMLPVSVEDVSNFLGTNYEDLTADMLMNPDTVADKYKILPEEALTQAMLTEIRDRLYDEYLISQDTRVKPEERRPEFRYTHFVPDTGPPTTKRAKAGEKFDWAADKLDDITNGALERALWIPDPGPDGTLVKGARSARPSSITVKVAKKAAKAGGKGGKNAYKATRKGSSKAFAHFKDPSRTITEQTRIEDKLVEFLGTSPRQKAEQAKDFIARKKALWAGGRAVKAATAPNTPADPDNAAAPVVPAVAPATAPILRAVPTPEQQARQRIREDVRTEIMDIELGALGASTEESVRDYLRNIGEKYNIDNNPTPDETAAYDRIAEKAWEYHDNRL